MIGDVVSTTWIVLVTGTAEFQDTSVWLYVRVYVPICEVFTVPEAVRLPELLKILLSVQVAHKSLYTEPRFTSIIQDPMRVIIGAVVSEQEIAPVPLVYPLGQL